MTNRDTLVAHGLAAVGVVVLLWLVPPVGVVAALIGLALVPPWGRGLVERALISAVVSLGIVALAFPRDSGVPITPESSRLLLAALVVGAVLLRLVPKLRVVPLPRIGLSDLLIVGVAVVGWIWMTSAYWDQDVVGTLSGLFWTGWDNQGHFLPFANTYEAQATAWTTIDGSTAWNQWYPALHSTVWALGEQAIHGAGATRLELLWPYVTWNALSFAASIAALAYVAGDLAARLVRTNRSWARLLAVGAVACFGLLGSPALLYNSGFTNFMMGGALVVTASYLSARSMKAASTHGWFLIPAAGIAVLGLWTPLFLGLAPAGLVVAVALWRTPQMTSARRRVATTVWVVVTVAVIGFIAWDQSRAILAVGGDSTAVEFNEDIGRVGVGMVPFNTAVALAAPLIALLAAIVVRRRGLPLMVAVATPTLATGALAWFFATGADANGVARLQSYYVLKALDGMLLMIAPVLAAFAAAVLVRALRDSRVATKVAGTGVAGIVGLTAFGYVGIYPDQPWDTFSAAPGAAAGNLRVASVQDDLIGVSILAGVEGAQEAPDFTPLLWDGSGHLPNLWVRSLTGTLSSQEAEFYGGLPQFPYEGKAADYVGFALNLKPSLDVAAVWYRPSSGELLTTAQQSWPMGRSELVEVAMEPSPLCPECGN